MISPRLISNDNKHRDSDFINKFFNFGTSWGIYFLPNDTTKAKKINGIDDNVIALTVDQKK